MTNTWQLQDAKNRLSEVVDRAVKQGPQTITRRGVETVVMLSMEDYRRLSEPDTGLVEFFRKSPLQGLNLDVERSKDRGGDVKL